MAKDNFSTFINELQRSCDEKSITENGPAPFGKKCFKEGGEIEREHHLYGKPVGMQQDRRGDPIPPPSYFKQQDHIHMHQPQPPYSRKKGGGIPKAPKGMGVTVVEIGIGKPKNKECKMAAGGVAKERLFEEDGQKK